MEVTSAAYGSGGRPNDISCMKLQETKETHLLSELLVSMVKATVMVTMQWHVGAEITHGSDGIGMSFTSLAELRRPPSGFRCSMDVCLPMRGVL